MTLRRIAGSVRVRITAAVALIFGVALSAAAFGLVRQVEAALKNDLQVRNDTVTQALSQMIGDGKVTPSILAKNAAAEEFERAIAQRSDGDVLREGITNSYIYATGPAVSNLSGRDTSILDRIRRMISNDPEPLFGKPVPSDLSPDQFAVSRATVETPRGQLVLNVASPLDGINRTVDRVRRSLYVAVPSLIGLVGIMTWVMTGAALRPVEAITRRAKVISGTTLHERVPEPASDDEIGELARTMNLMLARLEHSSEQQRRFMSDASHELRSPVASIKTQIETALMDPEGTDWQKLAETVLVEDERLEALVTDLLALSRLEEGSERPVAEVDLDEVVFDQMPRTTRVPIDKSAVGAGRVVAVYGDMASVVRNLIDNAERHAASQVKVSLVTVGPFVRLSVDDDGPGVAPQDRQKVFQRFSRLQEGRSRDAGGAGLGLALTRRIVEAHGGKIFIETSPLGGASFVVELPNAAEDGLDDGLDDDVAVDGHEGLDDAADLTVGDGPGHAAADGPGRAAGDVVPHLASDLRPTADPEAPA